MSLCDTFKRLALDTWDNIQKGASVKFQLKEETITDINILALKTRHPREVKTKEFNKRQEGINGADWEWWFRGNAGRWIGFRIQAKIINIHNDEFEHLHYQNATTRTYQCDKLIQGALNSSHPKIPLYCFYIQTSQTTLLNNWPCGTIQYLKDFYGCSLTSAFTVKNLRVSNGKSLSVLQNYLKPWHCLVCCKGFGHADFITNIEKYARSNFDLTPESEDNIDINIPEDFSTDDPPHYVKAIWENENNSNVQAPDKELDGIVIISEEE